MSELSLSPVAPAPAAEPALPTVSFDQVERASCWACCKLSQHYKDSLRLLAAHPASKAAQESIMNMRVLAALGKVTLRP